MLGRWGNVINLKITVTKGKSQQFLVLWEGYDFSYLLQINLLYTVQYSTIYFIFSLKNLF